MQKNLDEERQSCSPQLDSAKSGSHQRNASVVSIAESKLSEPSGNDNGERIQIEPHALEILDHIQPSTSSETWSVFTIQQKRFIVLLVAIASFFSPLSANIYFPALNTLAVDFGTTAAIMNLTLTSYMIFQGIVPTIFGDFADLAGRRPVYIFGFLIYIGACVGIANCHSFAALLILRCLQSTGSSSTVALGSGVVADISTSAERGVWMGWAICGPMLAPAIAPVIGGLFAETVGWRWIFWFLVILAGAFMIPLVLAFPETGRNVVGNGSIPPQGWNMSLLNYLQVRKQRTRSHRSGTFDEALEKDHDSSKQSAKLRFPNPLNSLRVVAEKDVAILLFFNSIIYCAFYDVMTSAPSIFQGIYGFNALQIGLCFIPLGVGALLSPLCFGRVTDWNFRRIARSTGMEIVKGKASDLRNFPLERSRVQVALPCILIGDAAILCYGWVIEAKTSLAAPLVFMFLVGFFLTGSFNVMGVMLIDLYPQSPATATAANNLIRCLMGAGATAVILYMVEAMGRGWCFTFIAGVVLLLSPSLLVLCKWGPEWREARRMRIEARRANIT